MKTWLFNPFKYVAGGKALVIGIMTMLITAVLAWYGKYHLDGIIDAHTNGKPYSIYIYLIEATIDWISMVLLLYMFARILSGSSVRFVDFLGTQAMARYPMFFVILLGIFFVPDFKANNPNEVLKMLMDKPSLMVQLSITGFVMLFFVVWTVILMVNGYKFQQT